MKQDTAMAAITRSATLAALLLAGAACGPGEGQRIGHEEQAYRHPPPSTPAPWTYLLTCYADYTTPACGGKKVDGSWWYSTGAYSFGCGAKLELRAGGKCVVVSVVDNGPAEWVEAQAKATCGGTGYIIDASPLVSKELFGESCVGWSDCHEIAVRQVPETTPDGPCVASNAPPTTTQCPALEPAGGVISEDGPCIELHGVEKYWRAVTGAGHDDGLLWTNAFEATDPVNWARWQVNLQQAGEYLVEYYAEPQYAVHQATRYRLRHDGQEHDLIVDLSRAQPGWNTLATLRFAAGADQWVAVYDNYAFAVAEEQHIVVDALRLTRLNLEPPEGPTVPPRPGDDVTDEPAPPQPPAPTTPPPESPAPASTTPLENDVGATAGQDETTAAGCALARAPGPTGTWLFVGLLLALSGCHAGRRQRRRRRRR